MRLPNMRYVDRIVKTTQIKFKGLNHTDGAQDGEIYDMRNMSGDHFPLLSTRPHRCRLGGWANAGGIYAWEKLCIVNGNQFLYDGVAKGEVSIGDKVFCCIAPYIVIFPDKCYYNYETDVFGSLEATWEGESITFGAGIVLNEAAQANTITCAGVNWDNYFKVGDAVTITGCTKYPVNNKTPIIRGIKGDKLYFSENCFTLAGNDGTTEYTEEGAIYIKRTVPELTHLCENENRLFGCCGNTIHASKLGDPFNWFVYDGLDTDSWTCDTGSAGDFTGCISYGGYPVFFKEDRIVKVYGTLPSSFSLQGVETMGVLAGSGSSLAIAGGTLFYLGRNGVMAYSGGIPKLIGEDLGTEHLRNAVAGSDGMKYYICVQAPDDGWRLYVYDTRYGYWYREDDLHITHFARLDGRLYFMQSNGEVWWCGMEGVYPENAKGFDDPVLWAVEFADFIENEPNRKGISKLQLRMRMDEMASLKVMLQFDGDGVWHTVKELVGNGVKRSIYLPIVPRRCDHYRLRLEGTGRCQIFSLAREYYVGSEF